jgi:hypothetical protein
MACVLPALMQHHHVTHGKGMPGKVCRVVYVELGINIFKAHALYATLSSDEFNFVHKKSRDL